MPRAPKQTTVDPHADETVTVMLPSGSMWEVFPREVAFFNERANKYRKEYALANISDLAELDRVLQFETLCHRYMTWEANNCDYWNEPAPNSVTSDLIKRYCVDDATEILTRRGWSSYKDVEVGDPVLTLNTNTGAAEWCPVLALHVYEDPSPVVHLQTREHDSVSTPDHLWPVRSAEAEARQDGAVRMVPSWRLRGNDTVIRSAVGAAATEAVVSDSFVEVVAWFWTEGSSHRRPNGRRYNGCVDQSWRANPSKCEAIEATLTALWGAPQDDRLPRDDGGRPLWTRHDYHDGAMRKYSLSRSALAAVLEVFEDPDEKILKTEFLVSLTQSQMETFIGISIDADGWVRSWAIKSPWGAGSGRCLAQKSYGRANQFATACSLAGIPVSFRASGPSWLVTLLSDRACCPIRALAASKRQPVWSVADRVWCPETANGTWLARREGTIYYTGNSTEVRMVKQALGIDKVTRDKTQGDDSVATRWADVVKRAGEFKVLRNNQFDMALELVNELMAKVVLADRSNDDEKKMLEVRDTDIIDWIRNFLTPKYRKIDEEFRRTQQKMWVEDINR